MQRNLLLKGQGACSQYTLRAVLTNESTSVIRVDHIAAAPIFRCVEPQDSGFWPHKPLPEKRIDGNSEETCSPCPRASQECALQGDLLLCQHEKPQKRSKGKEIASHHQLQQAASISLISPSMLQLNDLIVWLLLSEAF